MAAAAAAVIDTTIAATKLGAGVKGDRQKLRVRETERGVAHNTGVSDSLSLYLWSASMRLRAITVESARQTVESGSVGGGAGGRDWSHGMGRVLALP